MNSRITRFALALGAVFALMGASNAMAAGPQAGQWYGVIFGGDYDPAPDELDNHGMGGFRFGYVVTPSFMVGGSLGLLSIDNDFDLSGGTTGNVEADFTFFDVNATYALFKPDRRFRLALTGGLGFASVSADVTVSGQGVTIVAPDLTENSFTLNAGMGPVIRITDRTFVRLLNRFRWYEKREEDNVDRELTLGFGFLFGG